MLQIQSTYFSVHFQYAFLKYVAYLQSTYLKEKIRIGYVLKSAEVRTLVSRRYSENSSHTHPVHTHVYMHTPEHFHTYPGPPPHSQAYPCTITHTPHIPTNALNLINHMKFYINRPNTKKATNRERKKKEGTRVR